MCCQYCQQRQSSSVFTANTTACLVAELLSIGTPGASPQDTRRLIVYLVKHRMNRSFGWHEMADVLEASQFDAWDVWHGGMAYHEWLSREDPADDYFPHSHAVKPMYLVRRLVKDLLCAEVLNLMIQRGLYAHRSLG
jgi:hypothetical protein